MSDEQQSGGPDLSTDPREQGTAQGYPESNPAGTTPEEGTEPGRGPEAGNTQPDAPAEGADERPSTATGNPGAAGG